ncbi:hypothetical protein [Polyangium mundeleinium]|uniref:Uncharacterized protein n=1 Tax=Polyangium mundeleinium TaxID=2995306 RepID=A0ABT5EMF8_9BACT|nr:hypothetical protein [Polyangium mundeleinium]MDC0742552.1 hypothetical protein [Polyangium mundeleinium]
MICILDGHPVESTSLTVREMGTGGVPAPLLHDVTLVFDRAEFVALLSSAYAALGKALNEDIRLVGDADDDERACVMHPSLAGLLDSTPATLSGLMRDYLWNDLLRVCFGTNAVEVCEYVIDAYKSLKVEASVVAIDATAYHVRPFETR